MFQVGFLAGMSIRIIGNISKALQAVADFTPNRFLD